MFYKVSVAHFNTLAELFTNISAGFLGLVFLTPVTTFDPFIMMKNLLSSVFFYYLAVQLREFIL